MIVVSDTSALTALIQVGREDLLHRLYLKVCMPEAVRDELASTHPVLPSFLQVIPARDKSKIAALQADLDIGEAEAIVLAIQLSADLLLIDETAGRRIAHREGIRIIGLLGVLVQAKRAKILDSVRRATEELERIASFRVSDDVKAFIFSQAGE